MKKNIIYSCIFFLVLIVSKPIYAQDHGFGMGLILGEPTGISAKLWTSKINAFDFGLGIGLGGDRINYKGTYNDGSRIHFHMDYLWHSFKALSSSGNFPFYYGLGARINTGGGYGESFGVRGVAGIAWFPDSTPIDVFLELVPVLQLTNSTGLGLDAGLGIRYFFH